MSNSDEITVESTPSALTLNVTESSHGAFTLDLSVDDTVALNLSTDGLSTVTIEAITTSTLTD